MFSYSTTSGDSTNLGTVPNMWECKLKKVPESRVLQIHTHTHTHTLVHRPVCVNYSPVQAPGSDRLTD